MKEVTNYLKRLEFAAIEIELYLTLLENGSMPVSQLAEKVHINRTSAYIHIESLSKKGVVIKTKGRINQVSATSPDSLKFLVESKSKQVKTLESELPSIISSLHASFSGNNVSSGSEMEYYKGRNAVKAIYKDALKSDEIRSYFDPAAIADIFPENIVFFFEALTNNPKMVVYEIAEDVPQARKQVPVTPAPDRHQWKFLPSDIKLTSNDILIYDGKVAIINLRDKNNINGVVMSNPDYFDNSKQLFDLLWRLLPAPQL